MRFAHACIRGRDPEASRRFHRSLGFEPRRRLNFEAAYKLYMGPPGGGDTLELTVNRGRDEPSELRDGYNHMAVIVDDLDALLVSLAREGVEPEKPPYSPGGREEVGRICFVRDPHDYQIELITATSRRRRTPSRPRPMSSDAAIARVTSACVRPAVRCCHTLRERSLDV